MMQMFLVLNFSRGLRALKIKKQIFNKTAFNTNIYQQISIEQFSRNTERETTHRFQVANYKCTTDAVSSCVLSLDYTIVKGLFFISQHLQNSSESTFYCVQVLVYIYILSDFIQICNKNTHIYQKCEGATDMLKNRCSAATENI